ncbi:hypothetical protein [Nocardioides sp. Root190]|uniref:hypothetical protein n=1 Tax=Nocardioides sp. Root190 TaxID=1736488 RepID=UPI0012FBA92F|nr:hypothetical protein [Nocardioides sp. Root190]
MADPGGFPAVFDRYDGADLRIGPDSQFAWAGAVFWSTRFFPVWIVLATIATATGELDPLTAYLGLLVLILPCAFLMCGVTSLWWLLGPGRISYVVSDGTLMVCRGQRVLRRFSCAEITRLDLDGTMTWKRLLLRRRIPDWPTLSVDRTNWPTTRLLVGPQTQRRILLWGEDRVRRAEADLRRAVTSCGANLIDTGDR